MPANFTPLPLQIIEDDPDPEAYYLSMYMAVIDTGDSKPVTRIDLFTYSEDLDGERGLQFVSSYISVPQALIKLGMLKTFHEIFDFFARDSVTGEPAYPHYYTDTLTVDSDGFNLVYPETSSSIELTNCAPPVSATGRFTLKFIMANSQIYRNGYDKNINYFNQSFIDANVETRDMGCITHSTKNLP